MSTKADAMRALTGLYIAVEESVARDVNEKVGAYIAALEEALRERKYRRSPPMQRAPLNTPIDELPDWDPEEKP